MPFPKKFTREQLNRAEKLGIPKATLYKRLKSGWTAEKACSTPSNKYPKVTRNNSGKIQKKTTSNKPGYISKRFDLSEKHDRLLCQLTEQRGLTQSDYLREIVEAYLETA